MSLTTFASSSLFSTIMELLSGHQQKLLVTWKNMTFRNRQVENQRREIVTECLLMCQAHASTPRTNRPTLGALCLFWGGEEAE